MIYKNNITLLHQYHLLKKIYYNFVNYYNCYYEKIGNNEPIKLEDLPFDIPDNWTWIRLKNCVNIQTGKKDANFGSDTGLYDFFTCALIPIKSNSFSYDGEYIILPGNGANVGKTIHYFGQFEAYQRTYLISKLYHLFNFYYLKLVLDALWYDWNKDKLYGSAIPYIKLASLEEFLIQLPPLEEQQRIIAKINLFVNLIVDYAKAEDKLTKLEQEFPDKLKKSILQYAIEGKLVKQDPNDEPASVLLEHIKTEKEKLIKEGKIKRDKNESYIYRGDDKNYYENLPQGWAVTTLSSIISLTSGTDLAPQEYSSSNIGVPYLTGASNISNKSEIIINRYTKEKYINSHLDEILLSCKGTIGKIVKNNIGNCHVARQFMSIKSFINKEYLIIYLQTLVDALVFEAKSMIPGIDRTQILSKVVLLPPYKQQFRISEKVNKIINCL